MKALILLASAGAFAIATPAVADPHHGGGHDRGHENSQGDRHEHSRYRTYHSSRMSSHYGRHDNGNHYGWTRSNYRHHMERLARGDRYRSGYGNYYTYNRIPYRIRQQYDLNNDYRYYYNNGYLYGVDPRTMLVQQVVSALLR